jgi:eukaryotic-like serine/threonine-protein kinase
MSDVLPRITTALDSRYRITRQVGIGGMATVFLAHDVKHERDVAIKVLHPDLAAALGAERFLAEIKTTAKLQHPHILPLLDSGEAGGLLYYVMPYVDGESLRHRLERETQLAVDDAVRIAREVLSALDYAHRHGVVHRDIKPENILIHEDQALVADFGIALAVKAAGGARMTQTGLSLGTPAYMAPEQAMGERAIDGRADIYATGAVLYEMLVGEAPFTGPTVQAIVARVMTESPRPVTGQRKSVPQNVNAAVLRSLEKLPADRFHSAAEFSAALATASFETKASEQSSSAQSKSKSWLAPKVLIPWAVAAAAIVAALLFATKDRGADASGRPLHLAIDLPASYELPPGAAEAIAMSDDGTTIAFGAVVGDRTQIILRRLDQDLFKVVPGSLGATGSAAFSHDGKWLAFTAGRKVFKAPVTGGPPTALAQSSWGQVAWIGSEAIVYVRDYDTGLYRVSADGRDSAILTKPDRNKGELGHWWPQVLPDGDHVLFTNYTTPAGRSKIEVLSLKSGKRQVVFEGGYFGRYVAGHLLYVKNSALMSAPFDLNGFRVDGAPVPVDLDVETDEPNGWAAFAVAPNGTLAYRTDALRSVRLTWSDDAGNEAPAIDSTGRFDEFSVSPDGRKLAVVLEGDVWTFDQERHLFTRLTDSEQRERTPMWSPDGKDIYYSRDVPQYDVFKRSADGSGSEQTVLSSPNDKFATSVSADGRTLLFMEGGKDGNDIFTTSAGAPHAPGTLLIGGRGGQNNARFSPDGSWIVYASDESGRNEVYALPYPVGRGPARQQLSTSGGDYAMWGADGRTVYYSWNGKLRKVQIDPRTGDVGKSETLNRIAPVIGWDLTRDGRLLLRRLSADAERHSLKVVLNWASTLDKKN